MMSFKCPKCGAPVKVEDSWAPNDLDKRRYGKCTKCDWSLDEEFDEYFMPEKEVIFAVADGSRYLHGEVYEVTFEVEDYHWTYIMGTRYSWEGPVKITIEPHTPEGTP